MPRVIFETRIRASQEQVFRFHERPDVFRLLTPWWSGARVAKPARSLKTGERALIVLGWGPLSIPWEAEHDRYDPPRHFEDYQIRGPFRRWQHNHYVLADGDGVRLRDEIDYEAPGGPLAPFLDRLLVRPLLRRLFRYRHAVTRRWTEHGPDRPGSR